MVGDTIIPISDLYDRMTHNQPQESAGSFMGLLFLRVNTTSTKGIEELYLEISCMVEYIIFNVGFD